MSFLRPAPIVSALFDRRADVDAAAKELVGHGFDRAHLRTVELETGRYLLEDEMTPERGRSWLAWLLGGGVVGIVAGLLVVVAALGSDASLGPFLVGAAGGALLGAIAGGGAGSVVALPDDDDEDHWLVVPQGRTELLMEVTVHGPISVLAVRELLVRNGARGFQATHLTGA